MESVHARPEAARRQILHRIASLEAGAAIHVDPDDAAVIHVSGDPIATLPPGQHTIDEDAIGAEIVFVRTARLDGVKVGGPAGQILDAPSGVYCRPRLAAEVALRVKGPSRLVAACASGGLPDDDESLLAFARASVLEATRQALEETCARGGGSLHDIPDLLPRLSAEVPRRLSDLDAMGLSFVEFTSLWIVLSNEETEALSRARVQPPPEVRSRTIHCTRCGAQGRAYFCTQCGSPLYTS
jgi:hypothetical protein